MTVIVIPTNIYFTAYDGNDFANPEFDTVWQALNNEEVHFCFDERNLYSGRIATTKSSQWDYRTDVPVALGGFNFPAACFGLVHDGRHFFSVSKNSNLIHQFDQNGNTIGSFAIKASSYGLDSDGRYLYTVSRSDNTLNWYDPSTGTLIGSFTAPANATSVTLDGRHIWIFDTGGSFYQYDFQGNLVKKESPQFGVAINVTLQVAMDVKFNKNDRFFYFTYTGIALA